MLALVLAGAPARASLTASETEQVRGYVATETHADRVRALVARPDLTADESAAAMSAALAGVPIDARRAAYLEELVRGGPSVAARPVLAVATVRGLLARVDALYAAHPVDLDRADEALSEVARAYGFLAAEVSGADAAMTDAARADVAKALGDHFTREASLLRCDVEVPLAVSKLRAQAAIALYDAMPGGATRRVDVADALGLSGPRRAALVETGLLVLDAGGPDAPGAVAGPLPLDRVATVRELLDRLPGAREGVEAVFVGDEHASFRARSAVVTTADASGTLGEAASPWGEEADPPAVAAASVAIARGLAAAAVHAAIERRPSLRVQVDRDGGEGGVATAAAMLAIDAPRTVDVAAARLLAGKRETAAWLADALGALAVFAPPAEPHEGLALALGKGRVTRVALEPAGAASAFRLEAAGPSPSRNDGAHTWRVQRDASGAVSGMQRDGVAVTTSMLPTARAIATAGSSWTGAGLVFGRLAGSPRAAIAAGPRVRVVGSSVADAVSTPAPGDDVVVEGDLHVDGAPGGVVVRAVPSATAFQGVSLLLLPGATPRAALLVADGTGVETAAGPVVELPPGPVAHVRVVARGRQVQASAGRVTMTVTLPGGFDHGDVALRAYPGGTLDATHWRLVRAPRR